MAFDLDFGSLFSGIFGDVFDSLIGVPVFEIFDLGSIFDNLGGNSSSGGLDFDLGDIFGVLTGDSSFNAINLEDILFDLADTLDTSLFSGFSLSDLFSDFSSVFDGLDLSDLFGGLDDDYYYLFDNLPIADFFGGLSGLNSLGKPVNNPEKIDLLDGLGDLLNGLGVTNILSDFSIDDFVRGSGIGNTLNGLASNDLLIGLNGSDKLIGAFGMDVLNGGDGNDLLKGINGGDILAGMLGRDILDGGKGNDICIGGDGDDVYLGGRGLDYFVMELEKGIDTIRDFKAQDKIVLPDGVDFEDLDISGEGKDALISFGETAIAVLKGIDDGKLSASNFVSLADSLL